MRKTMMDWIGQQMTSILGEDCEDEVEAFEVERERAEKSKRLGVRLRYLLKVFPGQAQHVSNQENPTFHELGNSLACGPSGLGYNRYCPRDGKLHCSIVDALSLDDAQKASHYLSWCWDYCLQMYLDSWAQWQLQNPDDEAFVWQDFFCNNQYRLLEAFHLQHQEADRLLQDRLLGIGQMVVMLDNFDQPKYLERIWCVYDAGQFLMSRDARIRCSKLCKPRVPRMFTKEMYTAALHPGKVKVEIILPPDQAARIKQKIRGGEWQDIRKKVQEVSGARQARSQTNTRLFIVALPTKGDSSTVP